MVILPLWFPPNSGTNPLWAEGWDSALQEVMKRLETANVPYKMESKFGEGNNATSHNPEKIRSK